MFLERLQDLSIYHWLKNDILASYPSVTVVDGFPLDDLVLPTVAVVNQPMNIVPLELGERKGQRNRIWDLEVYGANKAQVDELTSVILEDLEVGIPVYDYNDGFPPTTVPQLGVLMPYDINIIPIRIFPQLMEKIYWRNSVRFITYYSEM